METTSLGFRGLGFKGSGLGVFGFTALRGFRVKGQQLGSVYAT